MIADTVREGAGRKIVVEKSTVPVKIISVPVKKSQCKNFMNDSELVNISFLRKKVIVKGHLNTALI